MKTIEFNFETAYYNEINYHPHESCISSILKPQLDITPAGS